MLINNIDLSSLGVKLYDRVLKSNTIETAQEWLDGDIQPTVIRQQDRFKDIVLSFLVLCNTEEDAFLRISKLTQLLKQCSIQFDDINLIFDVNMTGKAEPERLKNGNFIVKYTFTSDYAKGEREIHTTNANLTNSFKLNLLYYQGSTQLLATESQTIRASSFTEDGDTFESIGVDINKYLPTYYQNGVASNLNGLEITYENLQSLGTLIINYAPVVYNLTVEYFMNPGTGVYQNILQVPTTFTYPQIKEFSTIGQLIDTKTYKPAGYKGRVSYNLPITVENLLASSPIGVFYDLIQNELSKNIAVNYFVENDNDEYELISSSTINAKESDFYDGMMLKDLINIDAQRPSAVYYNEGFVQDHSKNEFITYGTTEIVYNVKYPKAVNTIFVEYYAGAYPGWYRLTTASVASKYKSSYDDSFDLSDINIDIDRYHTGEYESGKIYNSDTFTAYESVITAGVLQVYYTPIDFPIVVKYYTGDNPTPVEQTYTINALNFLTNPVLNDIIPITANRPEGYQFDIDLSYKGEVNLSALTQASPIIIVYSEIEASRTKNVIIKYKQELSSAYSTINTSLITINEADCVGGVRLKDVFNLNLYKPDYYENGVIDGFSSTALIQYDDIASTYDILYVASYYSTPVRYYTDDVDDLNWIGSALIKYRVIDFTAETTLYDLGLNVNAYKPSYADNGTVQYTGPINFVSLRALTNLDVIYETVEEPVDPDGIDYPHRFLFLQHNDLGSFEYLHPEWTMNHAYINTGVSVDDMSKLTVIMECDRVDQHVPLHEVNAGYAYLFGSYSASGSFYMRFNNQTQYGTNLTGINTYEAKAGRSTNGLTLAEASAIGFSQNSGIYQQDRVGYSLATFTYSNQLQTESASMPYPLYLFANNNAGRYEGGLAGIGIYSCRIYYKGVLIRDYIPVQFYDKIGDKVAPSNCLYDKISQNFFEDGTKMDSFNTIDDPRYTDTNLEHKIGSCYVNYYKGEELIKTTAIWFRASDFIDTTYDAYKNFFVDENQPSYYAPGVIAGFDNLVFDFDNMSNNVYTVNYAEIANHIAVNYYSEVDGVRTLIATDDISLTERDFLQAPTFGDLIRLNKYKPEGYETNYQYPGSKVSLARILSYAPYDIVYTPIIDLTTYHTTIRYIKKVFGVRTYETIGEVEVTLNQGDFRDGEYIDYHIDMNALKPEKFYGDGETYQWFAMDERLNNPEDLKPLYTISYPVVPQYVNVNYYTDDADEANMIASTTWEVCLDEFDPEHPFYIVDNLPNSYINKYRPMGCDGGIIQGSNIQYTFETLMELKFIAIVYDTVEEPNDPESAMYDQKILYFGYAGENLFLPHDPASTPEGYGGKIPWIDLGYRPKEIGRLRTEITCQAQSRGMMSENINGYSIQSDDYLYFFGYWGPQSTKYVGLGSAQKNSKRYAGGTMNDFTYTPDQSPGSKGCYGITCRAPIASGWVYSAEGPQYIDGQTYYTASSAPGVIAGNPKMIYQGMSAYYRKGYYGSTDLDYNPLIAFNTYGVKTQEKIWSGGVLRTGQTGLAIANPYTIVMDAYNDYMSIGSYAESNTPYTHIVENTDAGIWEDRDQPKGTLSLFRTTNPMTGKVNIMPFNISCFAGYNGIGSMALTTAASKRNPYTNSGGDTTIEYETTVISGYASDGTPIYTKKIRPANIQFADFTWDAFPQPAGVFVWGLKIYDQDRLVRDMIPVAKGDRIYDYVMPDNGLFDLVTEIFFGNSNEGGTYETSGYFPDASGEMSHLPTKTITINPEDIEPLYVVNDLLSFGKTTSNYYDYDNTFLNHQFVGVPTWFNSLNTTIEDILKFNDFKPDDFHLDGLLDLEEDISFKDLTLAQIYEMGTANIYYKLRTFTKTITYYRDNVRIGSKDLFYSLEDIEKANTLEDLGINLDLYYNDRFAHGRVVFNEADIANNDIQAFIDAPSPIVVYDKLSKEEAPNILYLEYYRGGAYDESLITLNEENPNYLDCNLDGRILNPYGAIKYYNHYHSALHEDEVFDYFVPYQVRVINKYSGIHSGPARMYKTLAMIVVQDTYTIIQERNGWGRLKEYPNGWIILSATEPITGPGQNPDYDPAGTAIATVPFGDEVHITKLTVDRLWCYVPALESWIKAEDVSYNQAGKLYNGLAIFALDLNEFTFTQINSLADMGIYPEAYRLRFHEGSGYVYSGAYTYEAFSNLHEIDFVYPETTYNYTCIYYKDNRAEINELGRSGFSCSISDWNPDWDTFITTSWKYDDDNNPINPTIYRDTELTLTWDYFGFERNLFQPTGYPDGIYLWNPRSWDRGTIKFSFEELIRCGTQYVLYPPISINTYKILQAGSSPYLPVKNEANDYGIMQLNNYTYTNPEDYYDIDIVVDPNTGSGVFGFQSSARADYGDVPVSYNNGATFTKDGVRADIFGAYGKSTRRVKNGTQTNTFGKDLFDRVYETNTNLKYSTPGDYFSVNLSNHRKNITFVLGKGNNINGMPEEYYAEGTKISENTNLSNHYKLNVFDEYWKNHYGAYGPTQVIDSSTTEDYYDKIGPTINGITIPASTIATVMSVAFYQNLYLIHYWVPVPKGYDYHFNGENKRFESNGYYDLITGEFKSGGDSAKIYLRSTVVNEGGEYNFFDNWFYNTSEISTAVELTADISTYRNPDIYDTKIRDLKSGLLVPVDSYTSDQANKVIGKWFKSANQWLDSSNTQTYANDAFSLNNLKEDFKQLALVQKASGATPFYAHLNPATGNAESTTAVSYGSVGMGLTVYYKYTNNNNQVFYFDGAYWIPEIYTSMNRTDVNKNYAVSKDTNIYSLPVDDLAYKTGTYLYGERLTVLYVSTNNPDWGYTGRGWVRIANNLSEVV